MSSEKQQFIQKLRLDKYGINDDGTQDKSRDAILQDLNNAVEHLSEGLYGKDIHFILELIQNAEDNNYQKKSPYIEFLLLDHDLTNTENSDSCLCLFNNEVGFTEENIKAICAIGKSTKSKCQGYIGEKGIGFKSVFIVSSSPHIYSNGFWIKFLEKDPKINLSYIVPYWLNYAPEIVKSRNANTAILLPLKKDKRQKIHSELQKIRPETILFLSKLQNMTIRFNEGTSEEKLELVRTDNSYPIVRLSINGKIHRYWLRKDTFSVPENLVEEKRKNVKEREITIAFPLDTEKNQIEQGRIFAFLPTEVISGLPFLVNADFILSASRETIQTDRPWNLWLRDCIAEVVVKGLLELIECPQYRIIAYTFIPLIGDLKENPDFFGPVCEAVCLNLSHKKVVLAESGNLDLPKNTRLAIKEIRHLFRDITDRPVIFKDLQFVADEISSKEQLKAIGVNAFTWQDFYDALCDEIWIKNKTTDWLLELYNFLLERENKINLDELRRLPILVIDGGEIIKPSKRIYFFSNEGVSALKKQYTDSSFSGYLLKQELSDKIVNDLILMSWFEKKLQVRKFSLSIYLTRSLLPHFKNHLSHLRDQDILEVTQLILDNWELLDQECKENLKKNAVLLLDNNCIELSSNLKDKELIVPASYDQDHGWHLFLKEKEECDHLYILSDQYLQFKNSHTESLTEFFAIIGAKNIPYLKTMKFTKGTNYPSQYKEYLQLYLDSFNKNSTKDITLSTWMPPSIFYVSRSKKTDKNHIAFIVWLEEMIKPIVKRKHFTIESDIKEGKIDSFYYTYISDKVTSGLLYYLKSIPWVKSTKGYKKPGEIFKENKQIKNMFHSYLPYLKDEISDDLCKLLGVKTEITSETIIQYLQELSQGKNVKKNVVEKLYEYLAQYGKKNDFDQFKESVLIYIPEPQARWYKTDEVMWKDSSAIFGDVYGWVEPVYGDLKKLFTEKLGIKTSPDIEEYAKAWLRLQNRDDLADQDVEKLLDEIYAKLISSLPKDEPNWWKEFKNSAKVWVTKSGFQDKKSVLVANDEELRRLFKDIKYAWKPERFSYEEIMQLFDELSLQYLSTNVEIGLDESNNSENKITDEPTILTKLSKLLFCYLLYEDKGLYEKQFDEEKLLEDKPLACLLNLRECQVDNLVIKYQVPAYGTSTAREQTCFIDQKFRILYLKTNVDRDELLEEVARLIAKDFWGKHFRKYEDRVKGVLGIKDDARFKRIQDRKNWHIPAEEREKIKAYMSILAPVATTTDRLTIDTQPSEIRLDDLKQKPTASSSENLSDFESKKQSDRPRNLPFYKKQEKLSNGGFSNPNLPKTKNPPIIVTENPTSRKFLSAGLAEQINIRRGDRIVTRVKSNSEDTTDESSEKIKATQQKQKEIGKAAENWVVKYESKNQRCARNMNDDHSNHPGYDIESTDKNGQIRYIEVKGIEGLWDGWDVGLSATQFQHAREKREYYWIYVVEEVFSEKPQIHRIRNPFGLITDYRFDYGWSNLAEPELSATPNEARRSIAEEVAELKAYTEDELCKKLIDLCFENNYQIPVVGFELSNTNGENVAEAELAWENCKLAILTEAYHHYESKFQRQGWTVVLSNSLQEDSKKIQMLREFVGIS